jgi:hypothetical protein
LIWLIQSLSNSLARIEGGDGANNAGFALRDHELGRQYDEHGRADDRHAQL